MSKKYAKIMAAFLMTLLMVFTMVPAAAFAESIPAWGHAQIGVVYYESIQAAIDASNPGDTVRLLNEYETDKKITIPATKSITLEITSHFEGMIDNYGSLVITTTADAKHNTPRNINNYGYMEIRSGWWDFDYIQIFGNNITITGGTISLGQYPDCNRNVEVLMNQLNVYACEFSGFDPSPYLPARPISNFTFTLSKTRMAYTGKALKPTVSCAAGLVEGKDFKVSYSSNTNVGTAKVTITGMGMYEGTTTLYFTIYNNGQTITASDKIVSVGSTVSLGVTQTTGGGKLTYKSSNTSIATVTSTGKVTGKKLGKVTITITAAATSKFAKVSKKITVTVGPKGTTISKVSSTANGAFTAAWNKGSSITGYQLRYSTKSSMSGAKSVTVKSASTLSKKVSSLSKGKTYYVQIRTYKYYNGTYYYSNWSKAVSVKTLNVKLNTTSLTLGKGKTYQLQVSGSSKTPTYSSSNTSVATVSSTGKITAKKIGTATISVKVGSQTLKCNVTVRTANAYDDLISNIQAAPIDNMGRHTIEQTILGTTYPNMAYYRYDAAKELILLQIEETNGGSEKVSVTIEIPRNGGSVYNVRYIRYSATGILLDDVYGTMKPGTYTRYENAEYPPNQYNLNYDNMVDFTKVMIPRLLMQFKKYLDENTIYSLYNFGFYYYY